MVVADVLYLLPPEQWPAFFADCHQALVPNGVLLLKETEDDHSWRTLKCLAQEQLMVRVLRRTRSSGSIQLLPRGFTVSGLEKNGFRVREVVTMSHGYTTPHRPGARNISAENFSERMRDLENVALGFGGVDKAYAISAGREVRVFVKPTQMDDLGAIKLARDVATKIESTMQYPGTIKVNVIRETRAIEFAK